MMILLISSLGQTGFGPPRSAAWGCVSSAFRAVARIEAAFPSWAATKVGLNYNICTLTTTCFVGYLQYALPGLQLKSLSAATRAPKRRVPAPRLGAAARRAVRRGPTGCYNV